MSFCEYVLEIYQISFTSAVSGSTTKTNIMFDRISGMLFYIQKKRLSVIILGFLTTQYIVYKNELQNEQKQKKAETE